VIIDLKRVIAEERPFWTELEGVLEGLEKYAERKMDLIQLRRFHYLYQRASADLARIKGSSSNPEILRYLESLVGRAYAEIHETRSRPNRLAPFRWFFKTFPRTFRRRIMAFYLSLGIMLAGCVFGGGAISFDPSAKEVLMPFAHLQMDPSDRVAQEEEAVKDRLQGHKASFSSYLMTHNTKVSILAMALGMTWGIGTLILMFSNGVMLGAVAMDYVLAGEAGFLMGWLLPHGVVEIPAILIAGQAGLVLAGALLGLGEPARLRARFRRVSRDLVTLIAGVGVLLVWAGIIEAFLSQYHEPVIPYEVKIGFGTVELVLLVLFFWKSGVEKGES
jgi:uncharacterized membrane protein SpoIIM required for sporulation